MLDSVLRRLARDQWVRLHGTPRVTVLIGGEHGREIWNQWLRLSGTVGTLLASDASGAGEIAVDEQIRAAVTRAVAEPAHPIAVLAPADAMRRWRAGRSDRLAAMIDEGWVVVPELGPHGPARAADEQTEGPAHGGDPDPGSSREGGVDGAARRGATRGVGLDARSLAEATLFEALEATPATTGRFRLNESLSVRFGPAAAEIDLLSRGDRIAIEIDGVHHFADPDCYRRDRRKDLLLQTQGFVVVRLLAEDVVRDVRAAVTAVSQALAYRQGSGRG
jgi:very-short-patch-repair endonuclease